ncbi:type II toxin-antitoxin system RelE/ParE family toxin [Oxalobacteraceae bacterium]|nr:type II toxin-antitoxin system RelE/ParE family toxin [Oxalobacteraceae bacterium]
MSIQDTDIVHKGLRRFWSSQGADSSGISPAWASVLRAALVHLDTAQSLDDILAGLGVIKRVKRLSGHLHRYSMEINANWRLTFDCHNPLTGQVTRIDLEDLHRPGGAKRQ